VRRLRFERWRQKNWLLQSDNTSSQTSLFTRKFLTKSNMTVVQHPPYFSLYPPLQIKLKGTTEVNEAELQAVQNTLTEHGFQDAFKKWQKRWERCIRAQGDYIEGNGGQ
jgi:hypothetical protein